jgi:hypothetical protein
MTKLNIDLAKPETLRRVALAFEHHFAGTGDPYPEAPESWNACIASLAFLRAECTVAPLRTRAVVDAELVIGVRRWHASTPGSAALDALKKVARLCAEPTAEAEGDPPGYQELYKLREFQRKTRDLLQSEELDSFQTCLAIAELLPDDGEPSATDKAFGSVPDMPLADPDPSEARCGCTPSAELEREVERLRAALFKVGSALVEAHKITFEAAK